MVSTLWCSARSFDQQTYGYPSTPGADGRLYMHGQSWVSPLRRAVALSVLVFLGFWQPCTFLPFPTQRRHRNENNPSSVNNPQVFVAQRVSGVVMRIIVFAFSDGPRTNC